MKIIKYKISLFRLLFCIVLSLCCVWHVTDVSQLYFQYKTNVNVRFESEVLVEMPAITICTNVSHAIRREYLKNKFPQDIDDKTENWILNKYLKNLTLKEQILKATISAHQFFNSCSVVKPIAFEGKYDFDYIGCENISEYKSYMNYYGKCFTIFSQLNNENNDNYILDHDVIVRDNGFLLLSVMINNTYLNCLSIFFHSRYTPFHGYFGGQTNELNLNNTKYSGYSLSYVKTTIELLPSPYETSCLDYNTIGYKSQTDCIVKCKGDYYFEHFNGWNADMFAAENVSDIYFADLSLTENKTLDKFMSNLCVKTCSKKQNCFNEHFNINVKEKWKRGEQIYGESIDDKLLYLAIYLPTQMVTKYKHMPRLHLTEYICYCASVFSLWFGISVLTFSKFILKFYYRLSRNNIETGNKALQPDCYCFL